MPVLSAALARPSSTICIRHLASIANSSCTDLISPTRREEGATHHDSSNRSCGDHATCPPGPMCHANKPTMQTFSMGVAGCMTPHAARPFSSSTNHLHGAPHGPHASSPHAPRPNSPHMGTAASRAYTTGSSSQGHEDDGSSTASTSSTDTELSDQLLDAALKHVPRLGWSRAALSAAATDLGLSPAATGVMPR